MIDTNAYKELEAVVGASYITDDTAICTSYGIQPFHRTEPGVWVNVPAAVIMPACTEEVAAIVKICNKYHIKYKAFSTGFGAHAGPGQDGVLQVDLRRMNHLIDFDAKNGIAVVEPYTTYMELQRHGWPQGLSMLMNTAGPHTSILASITSHQGGGNNSASMGYNGRNLLGFEWVTPDGEILRAGSVECNGEYFSADGPGPSVKGIARGYFGYDGGLGIFTKAAVKLYNWAGPADLPSENFGKDVIYELPHNIHYYSLYVKDYETYKNAFLRLAEADICYAAYKMAFPLLMLTRDPMSNYIADSFPSVKNIFETMKNRVAIIIMGQSEADMKYKLDCLHDIVEELDGYLIGGHPVTHMDKVDVYQTLKANAYMHNFKQIMTFHVGMGADESVDAIIRQGEEAERIKKGYIAENACLNDMGDGAWACFYDQGTWGHCEATMLFNPAIPTQANSMQRYNDDCADAQFDKKLGGIGFAMFGGLKTVQKFSEASHNFLDWTLKLKEAWDPNATSEQTFR